MLRAAATRLPTVLGKQRSAAALAPVLARRQLSTGGSSGLIRKAFVMSVNKGDEEEYERRHRPIWQELEDTLKAQGAHNYSIFLHPETNQLFGYVEIESEERWAAVAETEVCQRWWKHMGDVMPSNPDSSPVAVEIREVFHMD